MQRKEKDGIHWLEFDLLADIPKLKHAVFLRQGGVSEGPYASLNLGAHVGDDIEHVEQNLKKVHEILGLPRIISAKQVHGVAINEITSKISPLDIQGDALATNEFNMGLMIHNADCQAAIFYDPIHNAVANVHAGWKGNVQNIYAETIRFMQETYQSRPEDLLVCISPSLGPEFSQFINYKTELPKAFWDFQIRPDYFDLWAIAEWQLKQQGILPTHIEIASLCTYDNPQDYFSFRRDKITGRHGTVVALTGV